MENQLVKIVTESGLDNTKSQVLLEQFSDYFHIAAEWEKKANELVITSEEQVEDMKLAHEGRLFLKNKRITVEKTRKALKENALREGQTIDAIAKILTNLITPIEKDLEQKEKFAEIQKKKRIDELRLKREDEVIPYREFIPFGIDLGTMDEDSYNKLLNGGKLQLAQQIENKRRAEEERIAREKAETEARERQRIENERLKREAEERERQLAEERAKAETERRALEEKARAEREEAERKAREEREERERLLQIERDKQAELQAEIKAKEEAERKAKEETERKALAEQRKREAEERKAQNAPDKEKLILFTSNLKNIKYPELKTKEGIMMLELAKKNITNAVNYLQSQIEVL